MNKIYRIKSISATSVLIRFLLCFILQFISLALLKKYIILPDGFLIFFIFSILISSGFIAFWLSTYITDLLLTDSFLEYKKDRIFLKDITGFCTDQREFALYNSISIATESKNYDINGYVRGNNGREFKEFLSDFAQGVNEANQSDKQVGFYKIHPMQFGVMNFISKVFLCLVIALDLYLIYSGNFHTGIWLFKLVVLHLLSISFYFRYKTKS